MDIWLEFPLSERITGSSVFQKMAQKAMKMLTMFPHRKEAEDLHTIKSFSGHLPHTTFLSHLACTSLSLPFISPPSQHLS